MRSHFFVCKDESGVHIVVRQERPERDALLAGLGPNVVSGHVGVKQRGETERRVECNAAFRSICDRGYD